MRTGWLFTIAVAGLAVGAVLRVPWLVAPASVLLLLLFVGKGFRRVPEGHVAVIERLSQFARTSGPGPVWVTPVLERAVQSVNVRLRPERFVIEGILSREKVPLNFSAMISYSIDFSVAERLRRQIAYYTPEQWHELVESHLESSLTNVMSTYPALGVIGPDQRSWSDIQEMVRGRLADVLKQWAIVLDESQGVILNNVQLPSQLREALEKALAVGVESKTGMELLDMILHTYPGIPQPILLELMQSLQGRSTSQMVILSSDVGYVSPGENVHEVESGRKVRGLLVDDAKRGITIVRDITPKSKEPKAQD